MLPASLFVVGGFEHDGRCFGICLYTGPCIWAFKQLYDKAWPTRATASCPTAGNDRTPLEQS